MNWLWEFGFLAAGLVLGSALTQALGRARPARKRQGQSGATDSTATLPVEFVAAHIPVALLIFSSNGQIRFANTRAEQLLFGGESPTGKNFLRLLDTAPEDVRNALLGTNDALFSLEHEGEQETFQMIRRKLLIEADEHVLLLINPLTREVGRREIAVLKKVIRVISHELNNSLASMSSLLNSGRYIIENPENLPRLSRVFDGIEERTTHLKQFLNEYAALSRLPKPRPREVRWAPLLDRLAQLHPKLRIGETPEELGWFDEVQLEQALLNLVKNAFEAGGPEGEVRIVFRNTGGSLEVGVLDRGKGFSAEALKHGLLPFFSTKQGGSGLGLALCREVTEGHGGSLRVKAREGGGSAVYLVLPHREQEEDSHSSMALTLTRT